METLESQILETWGINHRTNMLLMDQLTEESLGYTTSKRGGGTIGHQLAHMYNVRYWKLETIDKTYIEGLTTVKATDAKTIPMLQKLHSTTANLFEAMLESGLNNGGQIKKGWKRGVVPMLGSVINHEAHHRGNILLTLKLSGFKLTTPLKYGIWEWRKL